MKIAIRPVNIKMMPFLVIAEVVSGEVMSFFLPVAFKISDSEAFVQILICTA